VVIGLAVQDIMARIAGHVVTADGGGQDIVTSATVQDVVSFVAEFLVVVTQLKCHHSDAMKVSPVFNGQDALNGAVDNES
jgi:hypothetical protein